LFYRAKKAAIIQMFSSFFAEERQKNGWLYVYVAFEHTLVSALLEKIGTINLKQDRGL
jgi:hypothetical protein